MELEGQGCVDNNLKIAQVVLLNREMDLKMVRQTTKKMGFNLSGLTAAFFSNSSFPVSQTSCAFKWGRENLYAGM